MAHLILHIGSHKTGTTSIQHALTAGAERLAARGAAYLAADAPGAELRNANALANTQGAAEAFRGALDARRVDRTLRPEAPLCVASGENLFWLHEPEAIRALAGIARARFDRVTVFAYLRRQDLLALSHRSQTAAPRRLPAERFYGVGRAALPRWRPHFARYFDYHAKLEMWREAFGTENIRPRLFEPQALNGGDAVRDFLAVSGLPLAPDPGTERRNESAGARRVMLMLAAKRAGLRRGRLRRLSERVPEGEKLRASRAAAAAFLENVAESNARLAESWRLDDGAPFAFSPGLEMHPPVGSRPPSDRALRAEIAALLETAPETLYGPRAGARVRALAEAQAREAPETPAPAPAGALLRRLGLGRG